MEKVNKCPVPDNHMAMVVFSFSSPYSHREKMEKVLVNGSSLFGKGVGESFVEPGCKATNRACGSQVYRGTVPELVEGSRDGPRVSRGVEVG